MTAMHTPPPPTEPTFPNGWLNREELRMKEAREQLAKLAKQLTQTLPIVCSPCSEFLDTPSYHSDNAYHQAAPDILYCDACDWKRAHAHITVCENCGGTRFILGPPTSELIATAEAEQKAEERENRRDTAMVWAAGTSSVLLLALFSSL